MKKLIIIALSLIISAQLQCPQQPPQTQATTVIMGRPTGPDGFELLTHQECSAARMESFKTGIKTGEDATLLGVAAGFLTLKGTALLIGGTLNPLATTVITVASGSTAWILTSACWKIKGARQHAQTASAVKHLKDQFARCSWKED